MSLSGGNTPPAVHHVQMALCHLLSAIENLRPRAAGDIPAVLGALSDLADRLIWIGEELGCSAGETAQHQQLKDRIGRALSNLSSTSAARPSAASRPGTARPGGWRTGAVRALVGAARWMLHRCQDADPSTARVLRIAADRLRPSAQDAQRWGWRPKIDRP